VDPRDAKRLYASTWTLYSGGGGVYRSGDGGHSWNIIGLAHETVRALAQAPTDPKLLLAGALSGVYRSSDEGATWERITLSIIRTCGILIRWPSIRRIPTSSMLELITCLGRPRMAAKTGFRW